MAMMTGLRLPPAIAPKQIVVVPMLRDKPEDAEVLAYCEDLVTALCGASGCSASRCARCLDIKKIKSAEKRWNWVRRGAPIIIEVGPRDAAGGNVTYMRRDDLARRRQGQIHRQAAGGFPGRRGAASGRNPGRALCRSQGAAGRQYQDAASPTWTGVEDYFAGNEDEFKGWLRVSWSKPTGAELEKVDQKLKGLKLTIRNAPLDQPAEFAPCLFSGAPGVEEILIGRAY